jgi:hypothetical protein
MPAQALSVKEQVAAIRRISSRDMRPHERREAVTRLIIGDLKKAGRFFKTPQGNFYFLEGDKPKLFPIEPGSPALEGLVLERYAINPAERREYEHILKGLDHHAYINGEEVDVHRLSYFDQESGRLYVSSFNGKVFRLNGRSVLPVRNGTDGVFFHDDPTWQPYGITREKCKSAMLPYVLSESANFTEHGELSRADQRWLFEAWCLSHFFASILPTKALLLICGEKGGGKTTSFRKWLRLLFGKNADVTALERGKQDGFISAVCASPIVVFDNIDEHVGWLGDDLARLATGTNITRRKYYTTNQSVSFKPECFIGLTSRTPKFMEGRDDVLDRSIVLETARFEQFDGERQILDIVSQWRAVLWTELLKQLNRIVKVLRERQAEIVPVKSRMADFAYFAGIVARAEGKPGKVEQILSKMEARRANALLAEEPIAMCLDRWLEIPANHGRSTTSAALNAEWSVIAVRLKIAWPYATPHSLGQRLSHITTSLNERFRVEANQDSSNQWHYQSWPRAETLNRAESRPQSIQAV